MDRTLLLMRHAQAESFAVDDHSRRLTDAGRRAAIEAGTWLAGAVPVVQVALVSSAVRACETYVGVCEGAGLALEPRVEGALYAAGEESALEVVRTVDPGASTVLWVGHNPTVALLAQALSDEFPDTDAFTALTRGYPPAALTVLTVPGEWADLGPGTARVRDFHVGQG